MSAAFPTPRVRTFRAEREFGLLVGSVFAALGVWWSFREKFPAVRPGFVVVGGLLLLFGALWPRALVLPFRAWMALAERLSRIVTALILGIVFYLVVTPIGVFKRMRGWDPLERRRLPTPTGNPSFWRPYAGRQHDPRHFDRMF